MPSNGALNKENESLQRRLDTKDGKLETIQQRGVFVGGVVGGAAIGAMIDVRFGSIWGFKPSTFLAAIGIGLVMADKVSRKNEDMVLALALGMAAMPVYQKTVQVVGEGFFGQLFGGNAGGNAGGGG
jgi:uncharacterized protein YcfJ